MKPVVLVRLGLLAPAGVGVLPALYRQLRVLATGRSGIGRTPIGWTSFGWTRIGLILRCCVWRHKTIIPLTSPGPPAARRPTGRVVA